MKTAQIVSRRFGLENSHTLAVAKANGAYAALKRGFELGPDAITEMVDKAGLRGKGGGGAPAGAKWKLMPKNDPRPSYLVVNGDESEPGTFKDRQILSKDPHLLIEGMILTCYAIGAHHGYIYIRGEYHAFQQIFQAAVDEAYAAGYLGTTVDGFEYPLDITVCRGAGAYICGEKSAMLESMEGKVGHPRLKPHEKEPEWFFGNPTLVNNVETISTVPFIVQEGPDAYRAFGTDRSPGTLLFAMSGHVERPGVYEAEFGMPMLEYIGHFGGGVRGGKKLKAVIPGGASTKILTADEAAKATLDYESLRSLGSSLGTGGMIVMDEDTDMPAALKNLLEFYHDESCGQCTPYRVFS